MTNYTIGIGYICASVMENGVKDKDQKPNPREAIIVVPAKTILIINRPSTPDTDESNKKPKFNIPEPEDPMEEMELDLPKPNKGKRKQEYPKIRCTNCDREESPPIILTI
ncbi:10030_t:CDS:2 [Rhizophagus irregularis]|nr:10030_t:CDS:2 [Rhizophagus irregularis]